MDINDVIGVRNSTRNMTDELFDKLLPSLASQLEGISYLPNHSEDVLYKDWNKLCEFKNDINYTASVVRPGIKLCEHFFHNFYSIRNSKGVSFQSSWTSENLEKILRWNRKSHSTPYLSEIKRGIYFCCGLTKNTMYRPHLAKQICDGVSSRIVLDPCCGWGGRMLGVVASGSHYIGFEPNPETYANLNRLVDFLKINDKVTIYNTGAENISEVVDTEVDLVLTSPPYFNLEIYHEGDKQSENMYGTYQEWRDEWLYDVIKQSISKLKPNGISAWNVHDIGKMKMIEDVRKIHDDFGYEFYSEHGLKSSPRQTNSSSKKVSDRTILYKRG